MDYIRRIDNYEDMLMKMSVVIVTLNSGDDLKKTVDSVINQDYKSIEIIIKDGKSVDGSLEKIPNDERIKKIVCSDKGIYDAMNQAVDYVSGDYVLFMNCGDTFYRNTTVSEIFKYLIRNDIDSIYYGDCFTANRNSVLRYPDKMDDYGCFTKTLCHQATIYPRNLLKKRRFSLKYKIAADYEYYINCYCNGIKLTHIPVVIAYYQGNGASEKKKNRVLGLKESREIRKSNFSSERYNKAYIKSILHGVGIKHFLVQQEWFYPIYSKLAYMYYMKIKRRN